MEDRDFFDTMYQGWSKTTGAEDTFWMPEKVDMGSDVFWEVYAVDQEQEKHFIASFNSEEDAAFVTALHGCFGDLTRRLHMAVDEAERFSVQRDEAQVEIAELALENQQIRSQWHELASLKAVAEGKLSAVEEILRKMDQDLIKAQSDAVYWEAEARGRGED